MFQSFHTPTPHPLAPNYRCRLSNRRVLQDLSIDDLKPHDCYCHISPFKYNTAGHVNIGDLDIIDNKNHHSFKLLMDSVEDNNSKWIKRGG